MRRMVDARCQDSKGPGSGDSRKCSEDNGESFGAQWRRSFEAAGISKTGEIGCG
jgi:hypothetical protein